MFPKIYRLKYLLAFHRIKKLFKILSLRNKQNSIKMKTLKKIGIGLLAFIALVVIVSFFLPSKSHVERSIVIKASDSAIFGKVNNLKTFVTWIPWTKKDPNSKMEFFGPEQGVGQGYTWDSENREVGKGKMTITQSTPNQAVDMEMEFDGMGKSGAAFTFMKEADGPKVKWEMNGNCDNMPLLWRVPSKYMCLFMDRMVGPDFEQGLASLKEMSEAH